MGLVATVYAALALDQFVELTVTIPGKGIEEPCFGLEKDQRVDFEFTAAAPLDFNLHYHEDGVFFPLDEHDVTSKTGRFIAPARRTYCLMWTNKQGQPVELEYQYRIYIEAAPQ